MMDKRQKDRQTTQMRCDAPTQRKKSEVLQEDFSVEVNKASCHGGAKRGVSEGLRR